MSWVAGRGEKGPKTVKGHQGDTKGICMRQEQDMRSEPCKAAVLLLIFSAFPDKAGIINKLILSVLDDNRVSLYSPDCLEFAQ